jgi:5-methylcytosine-specific restriction endonuclease McrA
MARALVLNATYEPLAVVTGRRAAVLVMGDKADALEGSGRWLHAERFALEEPSVIRLRTVVRVSRARDLPISRRGVFLRDEDRCQYCGDRAETLDHVVPRSRGGLHIWENVVAACRPCNVTKADRLLAETRLRLGRDPIRPRRLSWVSVAVGQVPDQWRPWLSHAA